VDSQEDIISELWAGLIQSREGLSLLEMSSTMIHSQVQVLEDVMEQDPSSVDLTLDDSDYQDVDDGGAMLVEDLEDKRDQENVPPPVLPCQDTVRNIAPFTCFSLFFSLSSALTHIPLS
jgi:hypothetical protein